MKKKLNPELLKEELKKFRLLSEYDFYHEKKELPEYKDLILGNIEEEDDKAPDDLEADDSGNVDDAANAVAGDLGVDDAETTGDIPEPDANMDDNADMDSDMGGDVDMETSDTETVEEPSGDEEEIDVTSLVKGSEDAKLSADHASHNTEILLNKLDAFYAARGWGEVPANNMVQNFFEF